ncbi:MAG: hypothetical protein K2I96_04535, partial [Lachnospiraceae bacterium]|nr:hypothetical protein [Lachnospiraceae bacterium]
MISSVLRRAVIEKIGRIGNEDNIIVVLKGIPVEIMDCENFDADIEQAARDKFGHFLKIYNKRKYISYE